jgi:hypothetical protein
MQGVSTMPKGSSKAGFQSKAQQGYLFANLPKVARKFAKETPKGRYKRMSYHKRSKGRR